MSKVKQIVGVAKDLPGFKQRKVKTIKCGCGETLFQLTIDAHNPEDYILINTNMRTVHIGSKKGWR